MWAMGDVLAISNGSPAGVVGLETLHRTGESTEWIPLTIHRLMTGVSRCRHSMPDFAALFRTTATQQRSGGTIRQESRSDAGLDR